MTENADILKDGKMPALEVDDLCVWVLKEGKEIPILSHISFSIGEGERWAIAGESGAGKSMTMNAITALLPEGSTRISGRILFRQKDGSMVDLLSIPYKERQAFVADQVAVIFQDSINALNPNERVFKQWSETVLLHQPGLSREKLMQHLLKRMEIFGVRGGEETLRHFPDQLSGGMRQRIAIAMALESPARILIADEPTTSLDAITQRSTVDFIRTLLDGSGRTLLYISHNLGILQYMCDHIMILKNGLMVEQGTTEELFYHGKEPYTRELVRGTLAIMGDSNLRD
ncbi:MAG: ABC transporter ATP-binding protein [Blautia sp.]|nr:ABC transporter ATP-binding protein [Blautia sp.]